MKKKSMSHDAKMMKGMTPAQKAKFKKMDEVADKKIVKKVMAKKKAK